MTTPCSRALPAHRDHPALQPTQQPAQQPAAPALTIRVLPAALLPLRVVSGCILSVRSLLVRSLCFCLMLFWSALAQAQPALPSSELLFDARLIPQDDSAALELTVIDAASQSGADIAGRSGEPDAGRRDEIAAAIADYTSRIGNPAATDGAGLNQLTEDLLATGKLHQELGDHEQAVDFLMRARNNSRINQGIGALEQVPILLALADSHAALGQLQEADAAQQGVLDIAIDSYGEGTPQAATALLRMGDWNLRAFLERSSIALNFHRLNSRELTNINNISTGSSGASIGAIQDRSGITTPLNNLYQAQNNYQQGITVLLQTGDHANPALLELERKLLTTMFLRTHQENIVYSPDFYLSRKTGTTGTRLDTSSQALRQSDDYTAGRLSLERRMAYLASNEQRTPEQVASTLLEQADWELLYERSNNAEQMYAAAYQFFEDNPAMLDSIRDQVYPVAPVVLPTFLPAPNSREKLGMAADQEARYFGYFDVSFTINRNGKARSIRILERGGQLTRDIEFRLNEYLGKLVFRPRYRDGKPDTDAVRLRYYVGSL